MAAAGHWAVGWWLGEAGAVHAEQMQVVILDLKGVGFRHVSNQFFGPLRATIDVDQWYYPEILQKMYIINAPWVFQGLWAVVRPWLHPITQQKIRIAITML